MQNQLVVNNSSRVVIKLDSYIDLKVWLIVLTRAKASEFME